MDPIISVKGIDKKFGDFYALKNVSLDIYPGKVNVLVGENGAGKSTLMKILSGVYHNDGGQVFVDGKEVDITSPKMAEELGIGIVYQELNLAQKLTVAENVFLGDALKTKGLLVDWKSMREEAVKNVKELAGLDIDPDELICNLGVAYQQLIELTRVMRKGFRVLIMDEPTAALTESEIQKLFETVRKLRDDGVAIIYISHRLEEIAQIGDYINVLRDGQFIGSREVKDVSMDEIISMMVGRSIEDKYPKADFSSIPKEEILRVENLSRKGVFEDISFTLRKGEILGFAGLMGAGRTEIARAIFGADKLTSGKIFVNGKEVKIKSTRDAIKNGIALLTEDRKNQGLILGRDLVENTTLVRMDKVSNKIGAVSKKKEIAVMGEYMKKLKIAASSEFIPAGSLSGGNQQKVVIAKWLFADSDIIIFDEPTRGIDVGAKTEVYNLINEFILAGKGVIVISSELPELLGVCNRIITIADGEITGEFSNEVDQETLLAVMIGGKK